MAATASTGWLSLIHISDNYDTDIAHITGWQNDRYDELIEQAYAEKDMDKRSDLLYQAETLLMEEMPVMPLFQYQNAYAKTGALSKLSTNYYGAVLFTKAKLKNASAYLATEPSAES